jgi:hypothetical protein
MKIIREGAIKDLIKSLILLTNYTFKNQWNIIKNNLSFLRIKETFLIFLKWLKIYRRFLLVINILALLNLLFTIFIVIAFSDLIQWEGFYPLVFIGGLFIKFAPVFIQELLFTYYFTITSFIQTKIREIVINVISLDKLAQAPKVSQFHQADSKGVINSKFLSQESVFHPKGGRQDGAYNFENNELREGSIKEGAKSDNYNNYIYWGLIILGVCSLAGVGYWYFYSVSSPKGDPKGGDAGVLTQVVIGEIEKTQAIKDKFNILSYIKNIYPSDSQETKNSPVSLESGSTTTTPASFLASQTKVSDSGFTTPTGTFYYLPSNNSVSSTPSSTSTSLLSSISGGSGSVTPTPSTIAPHNSLEELSSQGPSLIHKQEQVKPS